MPKAIHGPQWSLLKGRWLGRCHKCLELGKIVSWDGIRKGLCIDCYNGLQAVK